MASIFVHLFIDQNRERDELVNINGHINCCYSRESHRREKIEITKSK